MRKFILFLLVVAIGYLGWFRYSCGYFPWGSELVQLPGLVKKNEESLTGPLGNADLMEFNEKLMKIHGRFVSAQSGSLYKSQQIATAIGLCGVLRGALNKRNEYERKLMVQVNNPKRSIGGEVDGKANSLLQNALQDRWSREAFDIHSHIEQMLAILRQQQKEEASLSIKHQLQYWLQL